MAKLINESGGIRYMKGLRSPSSMKEHDTEAKKIAIDLPDVPLLTTEDNPSKWDLVFVCADGIVFAHRLVISSASKYIMHMFDDQPPWYPTYIHVLDLPRNIVQLLVDLAYTGEMRLTDTLQSDVIDAMHCLGWVHTDCLSADYDVGPAESDGYQGTDIAKSPKKKENKGALADVDKKNAKVDKKSPTTRKKADRNSFTDDDDSMMEISQLPDVDISDSEEEKIPDLTISTSAPNSDKRESRRGRPPGKTKSQVQKDENVVPRKQPKEIETPRSTARKSARRSSSFSETSETAAGSSVAKDKKSPSSANSKQKVKDKAAANSKNTAVNKNEVSPTPTKPKTKDILAIDETSQVSTISDSTSLMDSPTKRQRRKPKRFEEYEELDKPKPRPSPVKPNPEAKVQRGKKAAETPSPSDANESNDVPHLTKEDESVQSSKDDIKVIETLPTTASKAQDSGGVGNSTTSRNSKGKVVPKKRQSSETPKHSLITAYFTKKDSKTETEDSSDLSQECIVINESSTIKATTSLSQMEGHNYVDTNDNKLPTSLDDNGTDASTSAHKTNLGERKTKQRTGSTDSDTDEMPILTEEKEDTKKRSFDDIRSSHNIEEPTSTSDAGDCDTEIRRENGDESEVEIKPARKSSRVASKAQSTEENEGKNGEDDLAPRRKRSRNDSTEIIPENENPSHPPPRRASKQ